MVVRVVRRSLHPVLGHRLMRGLGQYLSRRVLGYLAILAVGAVLSFAGIGRAEAACGSTGANCATQQEAATKCLARANLLGETTSYIYLCGEAGAAAPKRYRTCGVNPSATNRGRMGTMQTAAVMGANCYSGDQDFDWNLSCPNGFDLATAECKPDDTQCLARNADPGFNDPVRTVRAFASRCIAGCTFSSRGPTVITGAGTELAVSGIFEWKGACPTSDPSPTKEEAAAPPKQECIAPEGAGNACVKPSGEHCHTTKSGFQACWFPGETGEKTKEEVKQVTNNGNTPIPPGLNLPNGDSLVQSGTPSTVTQQEKDGNGNVTRNVTTTTTNYVTTGGTNAGAPGTDTSEPDDGSGGTDSEGDDKSSVTGGANCEEADKPVAVGDAILSNLLEQAWRTRCAVESGNSVTTTGGDIADCKVPWAVTGPEKSAEVLKLKALRESICANAVTATGDVGDCAVPFTLDGPATSPEFHKLKSLRVQTCGIQEGDKYGQGEWNGDEVDRTGFGTADEGEAIGTEGLDASGYGYGGTCPTIPSFQVMGETITIDTSFLCEFAQMLGLLVLILAGLTSLRIMTSSE